VPIRLKALKPKETDFEPVTLGQHLKRRRAVSGLSQAGAASELGVSPFTILNREKDRTEPPIGCMPCILRWLAYDPFPKPKTLSERMVAVRRTNGWTIVEAAKGFGVDPTTWATGSKRDVFVGAGTRWSWRLFFRRLTRIAKGHDCDSTLKNCRNVSV
jgi:hypothetical protein